MIEWQNGITEWYDEWQNDIMTKWHSGIAKWHTRIAKWHNGIAKWRNGIAKLYFSIVECHVANQPPYDSATVFIGLKTITCRVLFSDWSEEKWPGFYEQFYELADMFPDHSIKSQLIVLPTGGKRVTWRYKFAHVQRSKSPCVKALKTYKEVWGLCVSGTSKNRTGFWRTLWATKD